MNAAPSASAPSALRRYAPILVIGVGAMLGYYFLRDYLSLDALRENRETLIAWRDQNYALAALVYVLAYIAVVALSLPGASPMTLAGGFLFGLVPGTILTVIGATIGAALIFLAARTALGDTLKKRAGPWLAKAEAAFNDNQISALLLMRLAPVMPFFVANLIPAFFGVRLWTYAWTTFAGILPGTAVYTSVGVGLGEVFARGEDLSFSLFSDPKIYGPLVGLMALAAAPMIVKAVRGRKEA